MKERTKMIVEKTFTRQRPPQQSSVKSTLLPFNMDLALHIVEALFSQNHLSLDRCHLQEKRKTHLYKKRGMTTIKQLQIKYYLTWERFVKVIMFCCMLL